MAESVVSSTDMQIFKRLANPDVADVELLPASGTKDAQRKATASIRAAIEKAAAATATTTTTTTAATPQPPQFQQSALKSVLGEAMENAAA